MVLTYFTNSVGESDGLLSLHFMTNIFDNAVCSEKFRTRDGRCAIFCGFHPSLHSIAIFHIWGNTENTYVSTDMGHVATFSDETKTFTSSFSSSDSDIISRWQESIFDNAGFGDKFITRKGECAIFVKSNPTNVSLATFLYEDGKTRWIRRDIGRYTTFMGSTFKKETEWDIISRWIDKP